MFYNPIRVPKQKSVRVLIFIVSVIIIVHFIFPSFFPVLSYYLFSPFWYLENVFTEGLSFQDAFRLRSELIRENRELVSKVQDLTARTADYQAIRSENEELRNMGSEVTEKSVLAAVLVKPPVSPYDTLLLDQGADKGIKVGDLVIAPGKTVIGVIKETYGSFSKVELFSSAGIETAVSIGPGHIQTVAYGQGGGTFFVRLPREYTVSDGEVITLPGFGNRAIGEVVKVGNDESSSFTRILFAVPVNIYSLAWVTVEKADIDIVKP